jgi:hypothetical protein
MYCRYDDALTYCSESRIKYILRINDCTHPPRVWMSMDIHYQVYTNYRASFVYSPGTKDIADKLERRSFFQSCKTAGSRLIFS